MFDEVVTVAFEIIGLQMQMLSYYKAAAVSRGHDEDTGFLLPKGGHGRSCFVVGNVLWDVMYWWNACLQDGISYNMLCFTERHVLLEVMFT